MVDTKSEIFEERVRVGEDTYIDIRYHWESHGDNVDIVSLRKHGEMYDLSDRPNAQDAHPNRLVLRPGRHWPSPDTNPPQMNVRPPRSSR